MIVLPRSLLLVAAAALLSACGDNSARYLLEPPATQGQVRVPVRSIEVRDVSLPAYASASEIMLQDEDGALRPISRAIWADDPVRGVTLTLARGIGQASTARVMGEPWPLEDPADARIEVRIEQMVAQSDGIFRLTGQYSVASPMQVTRERIERFEILQPMAGSDAGAVADAAGAALATLSRQIVTRF